MKILLTLFVLLFVGFSTNVYSETKRHRNIVLEECGIPYFKCNPEWTKDVDACEKEKEKEYQKCRDKVYSEFISSSSEERTITPSIKDLHPG